MDDDGDENVATFLADLRELSKQKQMATDERRILERRQREWEQYQARIHDVRLWCLAMADHEDELSFQDKRVVLYGLNVSVTVYPHGSVPRYEIRASSNDGGITVLDTSGDDPKSGGNGDGITPLDSTGDDPKNGTSSSGIVSHIYLPAAIRRPAESSHST